MNKILKVILIMLVVISLTSCKKKKNKESEEKPSANVTITLAEYDKLKVGMSYEEVTKIVGGKCNKTEKNTYYCSGNLAGTYATLVFEDNKLKEKKQTDLK